MSGSALTTETINDKRIKNFNILLETFSDFGVAVHEMGHILGAPDFYTYDNVKPVEYWDVMSNGNYAMPEIPHFVMHLKEKYFGWINDIPEITQAGTYTLNPVTSATNNCYRINSPYSDDEYFLLEYRRHISNRFGGNGMRRYYSQNNGLLITRIVPSV
jgi:M6 family metalloprotease-like protein